MKLSDFIFEYPKKLVANYPVEPRDSSRLMVLNRKRKTIEHRSFSDLPDFYNEGDVLVVNDTKVYPARLYGEKEKTGEIGRASWRDSGDGRHGGVRLKGTA